MNLSQFWQSLANTLDQHWLLARLFASSVELAVLTIIAAVAMYIVRPRTPRLVAFIWALVLAKPLLTLAIGSPIYVLQLHLPPGTETAATSMTAQNSPVAQRAGAMPLHSGIGENLNQRTSADPLGNDSFDKQGSHKIASERSSVATTPTVTTLPSTSWPTALVAIWLIGICIMVFRAIWVCRRLAMILRNCGRASAAIETLYRQIACGLNIRKPPQLRTTEAVESPALVGLRRAQILLPTWLCTQSDQSALAWSLRHELTHWRHGDLWMIRLREVVQAIFFFHPAAWFAGQRLELAIEIACDRAVISTEVDAADYAQRLYQILEAVRHRRRPVMALGLFATRSQIACRLVMLVEAPLRLRPKLSKSAAAGLTIIAAVVVTFGIGMRHESNAQDASSNKSQSGAAQNAKADAVAGDANALASKVEPDIKVTDVELLAGKEAGEMNLRFKVDAPAGRRFYLQYQHTKVRGAAMTTQVWESTGKVASIELKLTYFPEFQGDRTVNVLESNAERLRCDINAKDCKGNLGVVSIIVRSPA